MKKYKISDIEIDLEDKDWALIMALKDLTNQIRRLVDR